MKLSKWFNGSVNPTIPGWYLVHRNIFSIFADESMKYWDGKNWLWKKKGARLVDGVSRWKGLACDPMATGE